MSVDRYDVLNETWEDGEYMEPINIDLTTPEGFAELSRRAAKVVMNLYGDEAGWQSLAGRDLAELAEQLANDMMQESVSIPRSAFADHEQAGRELRIVRNVYALVMRYALVEFVTTRLRALPMLPSGEMQQPPRPAPAPRSHHGHQSHKS